MARLYHHDPLVRYPTEAGAILGLYAGAPLLPVCLLLPIPTLNRLDIWGYSMMGLMNAGGTALGTPFLVVDYAFVHWWAHVGRKRDR